MNSQASIYIPRMSFGWSAEAIKELMEIHRIGSVSHVDFTPLNKKPGFVENVNGDLKSAFVHFSHPVFVSGDESKVEYYFLHKSVNKSFWDTIESGKSYKIKLASGGYLMCLKNKNPVQRTLMNIHQVAENGRHLENLISKQDKELKNLQEIVEKQNAAIRGLNDVMYQLLGGLFCQRTQGEILDIHLASIGIGQDDGSALRYPKEESGWTIWPTTRQGDANERRITELENLVKSHIGRCDYADTFAEEQRMKEEAIEEDKWEEQQREACIDRAAIMDGW
jgi:hypothetical protein